MNTDIDEFNLLTKPVKMEILQEHIQNLSKKQEEINDIKSLIEHHINLTNQKITDLTRLK